MTPRLLSLHQAADVIGNVSVAYLRKLAADRYRSPHTRHCSPKCHSPLHRRFPDRYHAKYPVFSRDETGRWCISASELDRFIAQRIQKLEPELEDRHAVSAL